MLSSIRKGIIIKGIDGFYYVETSGTILECKPRGSFRHDRIKPVAGDYVTVEGEEGGYVITEIDKRTNLLSRPAIANVSEAMVVVSSVDPVPSTVVIDKMTAFCVREGIEPIIVLTKTDIRKIDDIFDVYTQAGFRVIDIMSCENSIHELSKILGSGIAVVLGNSGSGKSTLLNKINSGLNLVTGEISKKLGRGKHTTREVTLYHFGEGYLADSPGFASLEIENICDIPESIIELFPDLKRYSNSCRFTNCSHTVETGCSVIEALNKGEINESRFKNYCDFYMIVKQKYDGRYR